MMVSNYLKYKNLLKIDSFFVSGHFFCYSTVTS